MIKRDLNQVKVGGLTYNEFMDVNFSECEGSKKSEANKKENEGYTGVSPETRLRVRLHSC